MILGWWHKGPLQRRLGYKPEKISKSCQLIKVLRIIIGRNPDSAEKRHQQTLRAASSRGAQCSILLNDCFYKPSASESPGVIF